jgi:hypothetical protein
MNSRPAPSRAGVRSRWTGGWPRKIVTAGCGRGRPCPIIGLFSPAALIGVAAAPRARAQMALTNQAVTWLSRCPRRGTALAGA